MKLPIRRIMAEQNIKRIKKQLEALENREAQAKLKPVERADETFLVVTGKDEKEKLLKELEKLQKIVDEG
jgi:nitrate reductase NapAB chaperone NapD